MHNIKISEIFEYFGTDSDIAGNRVMVSDRDDLCKIPQRQEDSHKGTYGTVLIVAGSGKMGGAPVLCAEAALRSGCGIVKVFTHEKNRSHILARLPEAIVICDDDTETLKKEIEKADSVVLGPGLDTDERAVGLTRVVTENVRGLLVVDADALNILSSGQEDVKFSDISNVIFTPHIKEAGRLLKREASSVKKEKLKAVTELSEKYNVTAVLKDARSFISDGDNIVINPSGNSGMATAGSGDVLSGILGGLGARGMRGTDLAVAGVYLHGLAGDVAASKLGESCLIASDIVKALPDVLKCHEL